LEDDKDRDGDLEEKKAASSRRREKALLVVVLALRRRPLFALAPKKRFAIDDKVGNILLCIALCGVQKV